MTNLYDPKLKQTQIYTFPPVNNKLKIYQNVSVFLVPPSTGPITTQNIIPIPTQTNQPYLMPLLSTSYPQFNSWTTREQPVRPVYPNKPDPIPNDLSYGNCLAQLEGSYEIDVPNRDKIQIVLAARGDLQFAIVQRLGSFGDNRLIYDENSRFTLCSLDDHVEAVMLKGANTMYSLTWYNNNGNLTLWRRIGNKSSVTNNRDLQLMIRRFSRSSVSSKVVEVPSKVNSIEGLCSNPVLGEINDGSAEKLCGSSSVYSYQSENYPPTVANSRVDQNFSDDDLFALLQAQCTNDPVVLQKVLCWGIARTPNRKVSGKEITDLGNGRYWVNARLSESVEENCEKWKDIVNEINGAYQEVSTGMYLQPAPKPNEPGIQHRLRRSNFGYWIIEELSLEPDVWLPCTQELPNGQWVDCTSGLKIFRIQIIPMLDILNRMKDDWSNFEEMKKRIEFLFNSCNQKKLITRLKPRSLKHHILNLRVKLAKQFALCFAVSVANIADSIALEQREEKENQNISVH